MEIPLRTAYGQNGRCGMQPKAKHSLRAQAQLMRTETVETFELVKVKQKLLDIRAEKREKGERESDLSCADLKGDLLGRAQDWYQIFGSALVQNIATDFTQLKAVLSKAFPAIQNRKDLEIRFYASQQRRDKEAMDFVYDLLNLNKKLELRMSQETLVDHIFVRLLNYKSKITWKFEIHKTRFKCWRTYLSLRKDIHARQCGVRELVIMWKDEV
ncbi:uncharacterized protein TNCV_4889151 [Trichonephila clavipes]|nr:uncharacterized protein TNCV_4889151 [Trichonephila clavipes]